MGFSEIGGTSMIDDENSNSFQGKSNSNLSSVSLVTSFLVVFGDEVTKILSNSLFNFHFVFPILPCKRKTL